MVATIKEAQLCRLCPPGLTLSPEEFRERTVRRRVPGSKRHMAASENCGKIDQLTIGLLFGTDPRGSYARELPHTQKDVELGG
ncbi:unnamed protein product [Prunus armeniaca]|uniref:Uncharacterized protein n=1 Tax=Prunus armeniaca TaxID=36596 RepID=A0A6J5U8Q7_PRUAR|nr:unnamed protein product [Prunus armeniaca]